ncbi:MAG TPA: class I SAM-dependent methyltransferase [Spirochaetota bacterium]
MELKPDELECQLMKPIGDIGRDVGNLMNATNGNIHKLAFSMLSFSAGSKILEVGFGNGKFMSEYFKIHSNIHVTGIDFSDVMCDEAEKNNAELVSSGKLEIINSDVIGNGFYAETFDLLVAVNAIYFWDPFCDYIDEVNRIMKKGSKLLIAFRPKAVMEKQPFVGNRFQLFDPNDLVQMMAGAGFPVFDMKSENIRRVSADGRTVESTDICIIFEKK